MEEKTKHFKNRDALQSIFEKTFESLNQNLPYGIVRGNRKNITPIVLYEAISVGVADALHQKAMINKKSLISLLDDEELTWLTTGATNSKSKLTQRINFVSQKVRA